MQQPTIDIERLENEAAELLEQLVRIDTRNPPGNERVAALFVKEKLGQVGVEAQLLEKTPGRTNLLARLEGAGRAPSLMLDSHLDTVGADESGWKMPPLSGAVKDGFIWGRGALDMKAMTAMSLALFRAYATAGLKPGGNLTLCCTADEEAGSEAGAQWLANAHPHWVKNDYALGEVGGMTFWVNGRCVVPVQVAERGICWMKATVKGRAGHGSMAGSRTVVHQTAELINKVASMRFPIWVHPAAASTLRGLAQNVGPLASFALKRVASGGVDAPFWLRMMGDSRHTFAPMVRPTVQPTTIHCGSAVNVVPDSSQVLIDGRVLPGQDPQVLLQEVQRWLGPDVVVEPLLLRYGHSTSPDNPLMKSIERVVATMAPESIVVPTLTPGHTNGSVYSTLGTRYLGFTPILMPQTLRYFDLFHAANERCPVEGLKWGAQTLHKVVDAFFAGKSGH